MKSRRQEIETLLYEFRHLLLNPDSQELIANYDEQLPKAAKMTENYDLKKEKENLSQTYSHPLHPADAEEINEQIKQYEKLNQFREFSLKLGDYIESLKSTVINDSSTKNEEWVKYAKKLKENNDWISAYAIQQGILKKDPNNKNAENLFKSDQWLPPRSPINFVSRTGTAIELPGPVYEQIISAALQLETNQTKENPKKPGGKGKREDQKNITPPTLSLREKVDDQFPQSTVPDLNEKLHKILAIGEEVERLFNTAIGEKNIFDLITPLKNLTNGKTVSEDDVTMLQEIFNSQQFKKITDLLEQAYEIRAQISNVGLTEKQEILIRSVIEKILFHKRLTSEISYRRLAELRKKLKITHPETNLQRETIDKNPTPTDATLTRTGTAPTQAQEAQENINATESTPSPPTPPDSDSELTAETSSGDELETKSAKYLTTEKEAKKFEIEMVDAFEQQPTKRKAGFDDEQVDIYSYKKSKKSTDSILINEELKKRLYAGIDDYESKYRDKINDFLTKAKETNPSSNQEAIENFSFFRKQFIKYLNNILSNESKKYSGDTSLRTSKPEEATISLEKLLGEEGLTLYKLAVQEEIHSKKFREALLDRSTTEHKDRKWLERPIVVIGGPSGSGKSKAAQKALEQAQQQIKKEANSDPDRINYVITCDGGLAREVSQMFKAVIRASNLLGYTGVGNLQEHSKALGKSKKYIQEMALDENCPHGVVIPNTFAKYGTDIPIVSSVLNRTALDIRKNGLLTKILSLKNNHKIVFGLVAGKDPDRFKKIVAYLGSRRAWKTAWQDDEDITTDLNNATNISESKAYNGAYFDNGAQGSLAAFMHIKNHAEDRLLGIAILNDLMFVKLKSVDTDQADPNSWVILDKYAPGAIAVSENNWEAWRKNPQGKSLQTYEHQNYNPTIIPYAALNLLEAYQHLQKQIKTLEEKIDKNKQNNLAELKDISSQINGILIRLVDGIKEEDHDAIQKLLERAQKLDEKSSRKVRTSLRKLTSTLPKPRSSVSQTNDNTSSVSTEDTVNAPVNAVDLEDLESELEEAPSLSAISSSPRPTKPAPDLPDSIKEKHTPEDETIKPPVSVKQFELLMQYQPFGNLMREIAKKTHQDDVEFLEKCINYIKNGNKPKEWAAIWEEFLKESNDGSIPTFIEPGSEASHTKAINLQTPAIGLKQGEYPTKDNPPNLARLYRIMDGILSEYILKGEFNSKFLAENNFNLNNLLEKIKGDATLEEVNKIIAEHMPALTPVSTLPHTEASFVTPSKISNFFWSIFSPSKKTDSEAKQEKRKLDATTLAPTISSLDLDNINRAREIFNESRAVAKTKFEAIHQSIENYKKGKSNPNISSHQETILLTTITQAINARDDQLKNVIENFTKFVYLQYSNFEKLRGAAHKAINTNDSKSKNQISEELAQFKEQLRTGAYLLNPTSLFQAEISKITDALNEHDKAKAEKVIKDSSTSFSIKEGLEELIKKQTEQYQDEIQTIKKNYNLPDAAIPSTRPAAMPNPTDTESKSAPAKVPTAAALENSQSTAPSLTITDISKHIEQINLLYDMIEKTLESTRSASTKREIDSSRLNFKQTLEKVTSYYESILTARLEDFNKICQAALNGVDPKLLKPRVEAFEAEIKNINTTILDKHENFTGINLLYILNTPITELKTILDQQPIDHKKVATLLSYNPEWKWVEQNQLFNKAFNQLFKEAETVRAKVQSKKLRPGAPPPSEAPPRPAGATTTPPQPIAQGAPPPSDQPPDLPPSTSSSVPSPSLAASAGDNSKASHRAPMPATKTAPSSSASVARGGKPMAEIPESLRKNFATLFASGRALRESSEQLKEELDKFNKLKNVKFDPKTGRAIF